MASSMLTEFASTAQEMIAELGQSVTFTRAGEDVVNLDGTVTPGTPTTAAAIVVVLPARNTREPKSSVVKRARHLIVAPSIAFAPLPGDTVPIVEDGATMNLRVAKCDPTNVDGATPIVYDVDAVEV